MLLLGWLVAILAEWPMCRVGALGGTIAISAWLAFGLDGRAIGTHWQRRTFVVAATLGLAAVITGTLHHPEREFILLFASGAHNLPVTAPVGAEANGVSSLLTTGHGTVVFF